MAIQLKKATKSQAKLRMSVHGPSGSGKTYSALRIATALGDKVALCDTETGSASKYAGEFSFDVAEINGSYHPDRCIEFIDATENDYDVICIDSASFFWNGPGGFLDLVEEEVKKQRARGGKGDSFAAWKAVDHVYKRFVQRILSAKCHVITTLRAKQSYERETDEKGRAVVRKVGLAPEMRENWVYENDVEGMLDTDHNLVIGKTRCPGLDGKVFNRPGKDIADILKAWLTDGVPVVTAAASPVQDARPEDTHDSLKSLISDIHDDSSYQDARTALREAKDAGKLDRAQVNSLALLLNERKEAMDANKPENAPQ